VHEITKAAFFDELEKIAVAPVVAALGIDAALASGEAAYGGYKAIRHGKAPLATKLPYNPALAPAWALTKGIHSASKGWAKQQGAKKVIGRAGLATSKVLDAGLQVDPINAVGGMIHSGVQKARDEKVKRLAAARERGYALAQKHLAIRPATT
jgi:hypothetical protein